MAIGALAVGVVLLLYALHAFRSLELQTVDKRFTLRGAHRAPPNLVVVGIDSPTFEQLRVQWPFPRSLHARVIEALKHDGARVIVYDVQFTEPTTPTANTEQAGEAAEQQDNALIEAVGRTGNVVLATSEVGPHGEQDILGGGGVLERIRAHAGAAVFPADADGVNRRMLYDYRGLRSLGIVAAELAGGHAISPTALHGSSAWIDFPGPPGTIPEVPFVNVLRGRAPASEFAGKTVVVGPTASNLQDVHTTPFGGSQLMSGAELVAASIATAEQGFRLQPTGGEIAVIVIVAFGLLAPLAAIRSSPAWVIALSLALAIAYAIAVQRAFESGTILPFTYPLAALALGCAAAVAADSFGERRELQALERALGPLSAAGSHFFISYRRDQSRWPASILNNELARRFGSSSVFMDKASVDAGAIWPQRIERAIAECSVMLVLIGPDWLEASNGEGERRLDDSRDWVRREVEAGLNRDGAIVVPVLLDGARLPSADELPDSLKPLARCNAIALAGNEPDAEIDRLVDSIESGRIRDYLAGERAVPTV